MWILKSNQKPASQEVPRTAEGAAFPLSSQLRAATQVSRQSSGSFESLMTHFKDQVRADNINISQMLSDKLYVHYSAIQQQQQASEGHSRCHRKHDCKGAPLN